MKKLFIYVNSAEFLVSFVQFIPLAQLLKNFNHKCPLYARIHVNTIFNTSDYYIKEIEWSNAELFCDYSIISGILSVFYSIITLSFSLLFNKRTEKQFLPIWFFLTSVQVVLISITVCILTSSLAKLCLSSLVKCRLVQYLKWKSFITNSLYDYLVVSTLAAWLLSLLLIASLLIIILRIRSYLNLMRLNNSTEEFLILKYSKLARDRRLKKVSTYSLHLNDTKI